jgi:uncharacterized protein YggE
MFALKSTYLLSASLGLAASLAWHAAMAAETDRAFERSVSVAATGSITVEPDIATIVAGVVAEGDTARDATSKNSALMGKLIEGLKSSGIAAKDIQTTAINVEPRYQNFKDGRPSVINGYRVVNHVKIVARDLKRLGEVLDQAVTLGANQVSSIAFDVSNAEELRDDARRIAMANALRRAKLYAEAAGSSVGAVLQISEEPRGNLPRPVASGRAMMAAEAVPVEAGTQKLEVHVYVTWALQ